MRMQLPGVFTEPAFFDHGVNASIWTISVEVMLYIFLAALLFSGLLKNKKIYRLFSFIVAATCFLTVTIYPLPGDSAKYFALAGIFFMGGFCSTVLLTQKKAFAVVIVSCLLFIPLQLFASQWIKTTCILCIIICMFCWMIGFSKKIHFRLNNDISYGLYLIAFPLQQIVFRLTGYRQSVPLHLFLTLLPAIAFAVLSWRLIEKPCIAFARKKNKSAGQLPGTFKKAE